MGLPSGGENMTLNWSCTANLRPTSGTRRTTLAPLPRNHTRHPPSAARMRSSASHGPV
jgi:hypothetical protein